MRSAFGSCALTSSLFRAQQRVGRDDNKFTPGDSEPTGGYRWRSTTVAVMQTLLCVGHSCCVVISFRLRMMRGIHYRQQPTASEQRSAPQLLQSQNSNRSGQNEVKESKLRGSVAPCIQAGSVPQQPRFDSSPRPCAACHLLSLSLTLSARFSCLASCNHHK